jgi:Type-IV b secretion system, inner-membrane complex component
MTPRKIARYIFGAVASILGLLVVLLVCDSIWSNYIYLTRPAAHDVTAELLRTCHGLTDDGFLRDSTLTDQQLADWASRSIPKIMDFDHSNIQQRLLDDKRYFTPNGWCGFIQALADANVIDATVKQKLEVHIIANGQPRVTQRMDKDGIHIRTVETPVSFTFTSSQPDALAPREINDEILIIRVSPSSSKNNPDGVGISQWVTVHTKAATSKP